GKLRIKSMLDNRIVTAESAEVSAESSEKNLCIPLRFPLRPLRSMNRSQSIKLIAVLLLTIIAAVAVSAQRKPSQASRPFVVMSAQSLDDLQKTLHPENKTSELIDSGGMQLRVAVQHEKNKTGAAAG